MLKHEVIVEPQAATPDRQAALGWLDRSWSLARPWGSGGVYPNFPDPALPSWKRAYHSENYGRLVRLKGAYDPTGFFRFRQAVPLA